MEVNNSGSWTPVQQGPGTAYAATGQADGTYSYRVQACNVSGGAQQCSGWSNVVNMTVLLPPFGTDIERWWHQHHRQLWFDLERGCDRDHV